MGFNDLPGMGDMATWPRCTNHPNDPRTPDAPDSADYAGDIEARTEWLMTKGQKFDPYGYFASGDAYSEWPEEDFKAWLELAREGKAQEFLDAFRKAMTDYWKPQAEEQAEKEIMREVERGAFNYYGD